jgi:hypothetical protein
MYVHVQDLFLAVRASERGVTITQESMGMMSLSEYGRQVERCPANRNETKGTGVEEGEGNRGVGAMGD